MPAPEVVRQLVARFEEHKRAYLSPAYNEAQLRQEFLNPFFEALGWDVANKKDYAVQYREVIHEDSIHVRGSPNAKAPDYAFRLGGVRKFFVEAKKPAEDIENTREYAYQLKVYAWNLSLPLSILTDFEGFAVYDCRSKPNRTDSPAAGRIMYIKYDEYVDRWDEIDSIFSPDAIRKGAFDQYAEDNTAKRGTIKVDDAFLQEIETWRTLLARNIALRNEQVTNERQLNFAVQMTISRIIFLRICEDRGIEPQHQLLELSKSKDIYPQLVALYIKADQKYNSGLFHFKAEAGSPNRVDTFTPALVIDDRVLKSIIKSLYYPCPYVFKEIPVEILGQVYERFLGKVIRLTPGRQAKIEEKPEVRKAGGVYYTPKYIVDYIVENTVGKLLAGKTPDEADQLRVVDPACGSGSFLLGAFQYLMNWHENYYLEHDPEQWVTGKQPALIHTREGEWRLTTEEKKRILINNIYGVDIDAQAVEVTKLSLLLKVLEEETGQLTLGFERALPDLGDNIKCGNSLIGWDYFEGQLIRDEAEVERVNPFEWEQGFLEVFAKGGFDAVIGNPPYIRIQAMKEWAPGEVEFYKSNYKSASRGNYDIYVVFLEKGLSLLNRIGKLGYILPHKFFSAKYGEPIRKLLSEGSYLSKIIHFGDLQIFQNATTYTCLLFLQNKGSDTKKINQIYNLETWRKTFSDGTENCSILISNNSEWNLVPIKYEKIINKLFNYPIKLGDIADRIFQGLITGADSIFILKNNQEGTYFSESTNKLYSIEKELIHPLCKGSVNIRRYFITDLDKSIIFPYKIGHQTAELLSTNELASKYPNTWDYLRENRKTLELREHGKWKHQRWYAFSRNQNLTQMGQKKILTPSIAQHASYMLDNDDHFFFVGSGGGGGGGYGITFSSEIRMAYDYFLGLLNSKLLDFYIKNFSSQFSGGYYAFNRQYIELLPIRTIDFTDHDDINNHNLVVTLVKHMLDLYKRSPLTPNDKQRLQHEIEATDAQIDHLVYELYDLTDEEIRIVEGEA